MTPIQPLKKNLHFYIYSRILVNSLLAQFNFYFQNFVNINAEKIFTLE